MRCQLRVQRPLHEPRGQLLQQIVLAKDILRIGIVLQQLVSEGCLLGVHTGHLALLVLSASSVKITSYTVICTPSLKNSRPVSGDNVPASDFFLAGTAYITRQQYPEAVAAFTRAIERAPHDALAFRNRGIVHAQLGAHQDALHDLNTAITLDPQDAVAYNHRGIVYYMVFIH
jgi:tetratricopeptide (TPR) repeat protein